MATTAVDPREEDEDARCSQCHQFFTEPKLLPCGHLLCRSCLLTCLQHPGEQQHQRQQQQQKELQDGQEQQQQQQQEQQKHQPQQQQHLQQEGQQQKHSQQKQQQQQQHQDDPRQHHPQQAGCCPLCGHPIVDPESRQLKSQEEITHDLPTDLSMEAVVRGWRLLSRAHSCQVCEDVTATSLCLTCGDVLCAACKRAHSKLSALKHHRVEDLSGLSQETLTAYSKPSSCPLHPEDTPKFFCPAHDQSLCLQCVTTRHRTCQDMEDLEEKMDEAQDLMADLQVTLTSGETSVQAAIEQLEQHLHRTRQDTTSALAQVQASHDRLEASVRQSRLLLQEQLAKSCKDVTDAVEEGKELLRQRLVKMTSHRQAVSRVRALKNYDDVHVMAPVLERRIHDLDYSVTLPVDAKPICSLRFSLDAEVVSSIEKAVCGMASLQVYPTDVFANQLPVLKFHANHGTDVTLSRDQVTAAKTLTSRSDQGIVLSSDPLHFDLLYEVRLDRWENTYEQGSMCVGVLTTDPQALTLPPWSGHLKTSAIVIRKNWVKNCVTGSQVSSSYGSALGSLRVGSRVGVSLDSGRCLHVYVDGKDQGVAARHVPRPCFALFDLCDAAKTVTALAVSRLSGQQTACSPDLLAIPGRETSM